MKKNPRCLIPKILSRISQMLSGKGGLSRKKSRHPNGGLKRLVNQLGQVTPLVMFLLLVVSLIPMKILIMVVSIMLIFVMAVVWLIMSILSAVGNSVSYVVSQITWHMTARGVCRGIMALNYVPHKWRTKVFFYIDECIDPRVTKEKVRTVVISVVSGVVNPKQIELEFMNLIGADS